MADYDYLIRGGTIVDGLHTPRYVSDLAIKNGRIAKIGGLRNANATHVLDASGLIVAAGFVDLHTHYDAQIQWDPYCTVSGWHGVTSVVIGNCGFGFAPCPPNDSDRDRLMLALTRNEAIPYEPMKLGMLWDWVTFPEFLDSIGRIPKAVNVISYVPLSPIYAWVMGYEEAKSRRPTDDELREMCRLVGEAIDAGACGWSAQVLGADSLQRDYDATPMITDLMTEQELLAFAQVLGDRDEGSIELAYARRAGEEHSRPEPWTMRLFDEVARVSNRPVLYQLINPSGEDPERYRQRLRWLEDCCRKGLRVYGQANTRSHGLEATFEHWNLFDESPAWRQVTLGTPDERKAKMQDPAMRAIMRAEWDAGILPDRFTPGSAAGLIVQEVGRPEFEKYVEQSVGQIAEKEGKHVVDALLDIVVGDDLKTEFRAPAARNLECTAEVMQSPYTLAGLSDGGAHVKFMPGGTYATEFLVEVVRDAGLVSLEDAHYKLSHLSAFIGGFRDRGFLREGAAADIVAYDLEKLALEPIEIAHDLPGGDWRRIQRAVGYRWVLVNGQLTFEDGNPTGTLPGKLLRHGRG